MRQNCASYRIGYRTGYRIGYKVGPWGNPFFACCCLSACFFHSPPILIGPHYQTAHRPSPGQAAYHPLHYSTLQQPLPPINRPASPVPAQPPNPFLPSAAHSPSRFLHLFFLFIPSPTLLSLPDRINFHFYFIFFLIPVSTLDGLYSATRYGPQTPRSWQQCPASANSPK